MGGGGTYHNSVSKFSAARAVLYLPDHKAYTSTVYRPNGSISSLGIILRNWPLVFQCLYQSENDLRCRENGKCV